MKRRKPLARDTEAARRFAERKGELRRTKGVNKRNRARAAKEFRRAYGSKQRAAWIASLPCIVCATIPSENAHIRTRGAGGDWRDVVPLCQSCHAAQHTEGIETFQERRGIDLRAHADRLHREGG